MVLDWCQNSVSAQHLEKEMMTILTKFCIVLMLTKVRIITRQFSKHLSECYGPWLMSESGRTLTVRINHNRIPTRKLWCKASNTPLKSFSYDYCFTGEVLRNNGHTCSPVNSYKSLSMHLSLLVVMFLSNHSFSCHSNQSNSALWTNCVHSVEDYSSNMSVKLLSTYLRVRNKGLLSLYPRKLCLWRVYCFHVVRPSVTFLVFL